MLFNLFRKKKKNEKQLQAFSFKDEFENVYAYLCENFPEEFNEAKKEFIDGTGQFDEEHDNFDSKMDDFRHWFVFIYKFQKESFYMLKKIKSDSKLAFLYDPLSSGVFSIFQVTDIRKDQITLKDLVSKNKHTVKDETYSMTLDQGAFVQTALFETEIDTYSLALSVIEHPEEAKTFIQKRIKKMLKDFKKKKSQGALFDQTVPLLNDLMVMRYQLYKYRQIKVTQIYSDKPLTKKTVGAK